MRFIDKIKYNLFGYSKFTATKHVTKYAFTVGGVDYKEFDTIANLPYKRALKFFSVYDELSMKCDAFYLDAHVKAVEKVLTTGKVGLKELSSVLTLNNQLKERLTWVHSEDLVYKLASVVFFDNSENPDDWEWSYAAKKIEHWKKHESALAFFLHEPIVRLLPYLNDSATSSLSYTEIQKELDKAQLEKVLTILSGQQKKDLPNFTERLFSEEMKVSGAV
jgi:hypothetical protein